MASAAESGSDAVLLSTQKAQANASLAETKAKLNTFIVKAARDGVVISRSVEVGNVVQPGVTLMQLAPDGDTRIVVQVDEKNLGLISVGQKALVSSDAFPKETFAAMVVSVNPAFDLQRAAVEVKLKVDTPPAYLREDMTVSVDVEVARKPKALIVDVASLHEFKNGAAFVFKVDAGTAKKQDVKLGLVSAGKAEVLDGLSEGDQIIPQTVTSLTDGARVQLGVAKALAK